MISVKATSQMNPQRAFPFMLSILVLFVLWGSVSARDRAQQ
jgi:hypothetical protein